MQASSGVLLALVFLLAGAPGQALAVDVNASTHVVTLFKTKGETLLRYTLDGRDPDFTAGVYLAPIELPQGGTVKAAAFEGPKRVGAVLTKVVPNPSADLFNGALTPVTQNRDHRTYDWVERHNAILELNKSGAANAQVVLLGDSITHFWGGEPKSTRVSGATSWEKYLAPHKPLNLGFGWDRTENVLWRLRHGEVAGLKPKAYVLLIGTNNFQVNSVAETVDGIEEVCEEIRRRSPGAKLLLLAILPRGETPNDLRSKAADANALLKTRVAKLADKYLDLSDRYVGPGGRISKAIMSDFLHPTDKGYEIMGQAIDETLKSWGL
jgi:lysophospholipase L1-like esterase